MERFFHTCSIRPFVPCRYLCVLPSRCITTMITRTERKASPTNRQATSKRLRPHLHGVISVIALTEEAWNTAKTSIMNPFVWKGIAQATKKVLVLVISRLFQIFQCQSATLARVIGTAMADTVQKAHLLCFHPDQNHWNMQRNHRTTTGNAISKSTCGDTHLYLLGSLGYGRTTRKIHVCFVELRTAYQLIVS